MEKYKNKLWKDLESDTERAEFIECGRAWETGIIAKAIEKDLADVYRFRALENTDTGDRQLTIPDVMPMLRSIAACLDEAIDKTDNDNKGEWDKICTAVELLNDIAEDNKMFVRN